MRLIFRRGSKQRVDTPIAERPTSGQVLAPAKSKPEGTGRERQENGGGGTTPGDPTPHPPLAHHGGTSRRRGGPAPRQDGVAHTANVLPRRPPHPRRGRRPRPRRPQEPPQGRPLQGDPRGTLREGSGPGQLGHGRGGDGDRGRVQARDPRFGGRQDRLAAARYRVRRQPPHGRLSVHPADCPWCRGEAFVFSVSDDE